MPRLLILGGVCLIGLLALLFLTSVLPESEDGALESRGTDLLASRDEDGAWPGGDGRGRGPGLESGAKNATGARGRSAESGTAGARGSSGPYHIIVFSSETELPVGAVEIRTRTGVLVGVTDLDGVLKVDKLPFPHFSVRALKEGFVAWLGEALPGRPLEIHLAPGIPVAGHVLHFEKRTPLGEVGLRVWDEDLGREIASLATDDSGYFHIHGVRPNHPFLLIVSAEGFAPHVERTNLDVAVDDLEVLVGAGGVLTGRVLSFEGEPRRDVEIRLQKKNAPLVEHVFTGRRWSGPDANLARAQTGVTRSDPNGRYTLRGVDLGKAVQPVAVVAPRLEARGQAVTFKEPGEALTRDIKIPEAASLRIVTQDSTGAPIGHADLDLRTPLGRWSVLPGDQREGGAVILTELTPGLCDVLATLPGSPAQTQRLRLRPGRRSDVRLVFPLGHSIVGTVASKRGKAIPKALVSWRGATDKEQAEVRTGEDGRFGLHRLVEKTGTLTIAARDLIHAGNGYETQVLPIVSPVEDALTVVLKDGTRVTGQFRDLSERAVVRCTMLPEPPNESTTLELDESGRFRRGGPARDRGATFVFRLNGFPPLLHEEKESFRSEEVRDLGPLLFDATNPRKGRVVDEKGEPLRAVKVSIDEDWSSRLLRTDREGDFDFTRLPKRPVRLRLEADGYPANYATLGLKSEFLRQTMEIGREGALALRVVDGRGRAAGVVRIELLELGQMPLDTKPARLRTKTDARGELHLLLKVGRYRLAARQDETASIGQMDLVIKIGKAEPHTIQLRSLK